jgi:putative ABC transport system permease protein
MIRFADLYDETTFSLLSNKIRSSLTMLGIVIGISSVIALVAVGQGATKNITSSIGSLGSNLITVQPGATRTAGVSGGIGSASTLKLDDATAISSKVTNIKGVSPEISRRFQVKYKSSNTNTSVIGALPAYLTVRNTTIADGVFFTDQQNKSGAKVAVIGPTTATTLFGDGASPVSQKIKINNIEFTIIGMTTAKGGSGFTNPDDAIYIPLNTGQRYLFGGSKSVSSIAVSAQNANELSDVQTQVTDVLLAQHKIADPLSADFQIINQADVVASLSSVSKTLTILLGTIAGISLLVGGIGIMNMMLTSVTERTREIGLRKAVGAPSADIGIQFLFESLLLTLIGGAVGTLLGVGVALLLQKTNAAQTQVTWWSIILALAVSSVIGFVFGYYPARRASKLKPIEALKYE